MLLICGICSFLFSKNSVFFWFDSYLSSLLLPLSFSWHIFSIPNSIAVNCYRLYSSFRWPPPNDCPRYDTKKIWWWASVMLELWGMRSTHSLSLISGPLWPGGEAPDRVPSMGQIELNCSFESVLFLRLNCVLMQNLIAWNRTVFNLETVLTLNWIVWSRTVWLNWIACNRNVFDDQTVLMLNWIVWKRTDNLYKMDWALNNQQRLICHKIQDTHQPTCIVNLISVITNQRRC